MTATIAGRGAWTGPEANHPAIFCVRPQTWALSCVLRFDGQKLHAEAHGHEHVRQVLRLRRTLAVRVVTSPLVMVSPFGMLKVTYLFRRKLLRISGNQFVIRERGSVCAAAHVNLKLHAPGKKQSALPVFARGWQRQGNQKGDLAC